MSFSPVRELYDKSVKVKDSHDTCFYEKLSGEPVMILIRWKNDFSGVLIGEIRIDKKVTTLIIDHGIIEYYAQNGTVYGAIEAGEDILSQSISIDSGLESIEIRKINSQMPS